MVNKRVRNAVLGCNLKNDRMISVRFQGKPLNIFYRAFYKWKWTVYILHLASFTKQNVFEICPYCLSTHSSTLAWKIPWAEEPARRQSMGSQRVRHNGATSLSLFTFMLFYVALLFFFFFFCWILFHSTVWIFHGLSIHLSLPSFFGYCESTQECWVYV